MVTNAQQKVNMDYRKLRTMKGKDLKLQHHITVHTFAGTSFGDHDMESLILA